MTDKNLPAIFCAIDTTDIDRAIAIAAAMQRAGCGIKLGMEFFNSHGPQGVRQIKEAYQDLPLFLDLKYHDIPNTVAGAMRAVTYLGVDYVNIHASGGFDMMRAANDAVNEEADKQGCEPPKILAVTILTSLDDEALKALGQVTPVQEQVVRLAQLTQKAGLSGIVCSAHEIEAIRSVCGSEFVLMVPGIRPSGSAIGDQKRVMTPEQALQKGATHLVIGRPITGAEDPALAALDIIASLDKIAA